MKVPDRYRAGITRYSPDDADDLRTFQLRTFEAGSREVDEARTAWLFDRNPCRTADGSRDIYVCRRDGEIVGQQAEIPFDLQVGDRDLRAAWTIDLMVDDEWRLRGVGPGLMATQLDARPLSFGLNLSEKGYATYERSGWTDLGVVPVYLRPLDLAAAARAGILPGRVGQVAPVAGPLLRAADAAVLGALRAAGARLVDVDGSTAGPTTCGRPPLPTTGSWPGATWPRSPGASTTGPTPPCSAATTWSCAAARSGTRWSGRAGRRRRRPRSSSTTSPRPAGWRRCWSPPAGPPGAGVRWRCR